MPREVFGEGYEFLPRRAILRFEEIQRVVRIAAELGVQKVRITGGEPLLRRELPQLVAMLAQIEGIELALTTNGALLAQQAEALAAAGLKRVTVSLDSLDEDVFQAMNDAEFTVAQVLEGIEAAAAAGLTPIKINAMVQRGVNDDSVATLARHFKGSGHVMRFIEFMDVGTVNGWEPGEVLSAREILARIDAALPLEELEREKPSDVAMRFRYRDDGVEMGAIASITEPFCGDCSRARLSAEGKLYTCLFATQGHDLKGPLREGRDRLELAEIVRGIWSARTDRYSEERSEMRLRGQQEIGAKVEMFRIGG